MPDSEEELMRECAERQGKTLQEMEDDDYRFWSHEDE